MTQAESLVDTTLMWIEPVHKYAQVEGGKFKSKVYQLQPYQVPLMKPVKIGIRYGNRLKHEPNLHLYYYDQKEGWTFIPTKINAHRQVLTGEVKHLDAVAIIQDVTAPEIRSMHPGNHGQYPAFELNRIQIRVEDKLSGIDPDEAAFQLILDDTPLRFAYQPRKKEISYALEEPLSMGEHTLTFQVHDRAGNKSEKTITFKVN